MASSTTADLLPVTLIVARNEAAQIGHLRSVPFVAERIVVESSRT